MNLSKILDATYNGEQPYDALYEILSSKTPRQVAYAFADCFGNQWVEDEYEFCNRELVADTGIELPPFDRSNYAFESLAVAYKELDNLDYIMAHLSSDEIEALLDYYGAESDDNSDDEEEISDSTDEEFYEEEISDSVDKVSDSDLPTWRGVEGSKFRWHGEWADHEVEYRGKLFNEVELEESLWLIYKDDCFSEGIEPTEEGFEDFATAEEAKYVLEDYYNLGGWVEDLEAEDEEEEISDSVDEEDEDDEIENWEDYRFTFTIFDEDGEIIDQYDGTDVYPELSDTLYDDYSAIEIAKDALHNYAKSYDGEGDKIVISVDADEYDMSRDDYSGKVREVYSEEYDLH